MLRADALIRQEEEHTCAVALVGMAVLHFGLDLNRQEILRALDPSPVEGTHNERLGEVLGRWFHTNIHHPGSLELIQAALQAGRLVGVNFLVPDSFPYEVNGVYADIQEGREAGHFSWVTAFEGDYVVLADPEIGGFLKLPIQQFIERWCSRWARDLEGNLYQQWMVTVGRPQE